MKLANTPNVAIGDIAYVNTSRWLTHSMIMDAIKRGSARRMESYADECERVEAHGLAADMRRWAKDRS